jgi:hypothetical protein
MGSKKNKLFKKNLITLLSIFDGKPNILAEYLIQFDVLSDKQIEHITNNKELSKKSKEIKESGEISKPYFSSLEDMQNFYNKFFIKDKENIHPILGSASKEEAIFLELKKALENENFETAAKIRDYCEKNNIDLKKYFK